MSGTHSVPPIDTMGSTSTLASGVDERRSASLTAAEHAIANGWSHGELGDVLDALGLRGEP